MCGICGVVDWESTDKQEIVSAMRKTMTHRGPDAYGVKQLQGCCLGHQRLSIIDLSANGHQPMSNEDGTLWVVFNGELYGFQALVSELKELGHTFRSRTDTEVLLHGYESWGMVGLCERLTGMFAFALWDQKKQILYLARDRFGEKPLYYARNGNQLRFASNTKALFAGHGLKPEVNPNGLVAFLHIAFCLPQIPALKNVKVVPPATCISLTKKGETQHQYWQASFKRDSAERESGEWIDAVEAALMNAVKKQLIADVPVGCLLSGGVDSSLIASMAVEIAPDLQLFSVRMPDFPQDESEKAAAIARQVGGKHHIIDARAITIDDFLHLQSTFSEPLGDASSVAVWMIAHYAAQHVKVVLTGDGGDELFAGYNSVNLNLALERYRTIFSNSLVRGTWHGIERLLTPFVSSPLIRRTATAGRLVTSSLKEAHITPSFVPVELQNRLWGVALEQAARDKTYLQVLYSLWEAGNAVEPLDKLLNFDLNFGLVGDYLPKVDTATMASSLEARAPFLDHHLADLSFSIPPEVKRLGNRSKGLLKALLQRRLGDLAHRSNKRKQGFVVPVDRWLDGCWSPLVENLYDSPLIQDGILTFNGVKTIINGGKTEPQRYSRLRYSLVVLDLWYKNILSW